MWYNSMCTTMSYVRNPITKRPILVRGRTYHTLERQGVRVKRLKRYAKKPSFSRASQSMPNLMTRRRHPSAKKKTMATLVFEFQIPHGSITGMGKSRYRLRAPRPLSDLLQEADRRYRSIILVHHGTLVGLGDNTPLEMPVGMVWRHSTSSSIIPIIIMPMGDAVKGSQYALLLKYLEAGFTKLPAAPPSSSSSLLPSAIETSENDALTARILALRAEHPSWSFLRALREAKSTT